MIQNFKKGRKLALVNTLHIVILEVVVQVQDLGTKMINQTTAQNVLFDKLRD